MKIYKRWFFWAIVGFILVWIVAQTFFPPTQARMKQLMKSGAKAIEREHVGKIESLLAPEFRAETSIDRDAAILFLDKLFRKYEKIRIELEEMRVVVNDEKSEAKVYFSAWAEGTIAATMMQDKPVREAEAVEEAVAVWRKTDKGWRLVTLDYVGLEDLEKE